MPQTCNAPCLKILIPYYSFGGNTRDVALALREKTCGVLFRVDIRAPYGERTVDAESLFELENGILPPLKYPVPPMHSYDFILAGGPVWHGSLPPPLSSFLRQADFSGKPVAAFCTHQERPGGFFAAFAALARNAELRKGLSLDITRRNYAGRTEAALARWLETIGICSPKPKSACPSHALARHNCARIG